MSLRAALLALLDALAFSGVWVAGAAAALAAAVSLALGTVPPARLVGLAFAGTFAVYATDRLRDLARDRATAPLRSAFVARHRRALAAAAALAAFAAAGLALASGPVACALAAAAGALGLAHRRLKHVVEAKGLYVAGAWTLVTVGLPASAAAAGAADVGWAAALVGAGLLANAAASSARDGEAVAARHPPARVLRFALGLASLAAAAALVAPPALRPLGAVPLATALSLARFRASERYGLLVLDGALVAGAALAALLRVAPG